MNVSRVAKVDELKGFSYSNHQLAIAERHAPQESDVFFQRLMQTPFRIVGQVFKDTAIDDIEYILEDDIPQQLQKDPFYSRWVSDMAEICTAFCEVQRSDVIGFCLGTERGCSRYHIDNVPMRLLVTYAGQGTEWLPDEAADRNAFANGAPNEKIVKDLSARQYMNSWDVAIFRGGSKGLLHRTPDAAINASSILMRLDHATFWDFVSKNSN